MDHAIAGERRSTMAPHLKHGVSGPELMELMRQQAINFGTRIITDDVVKVDLKQGKNLILLKLDQGNGAAGLTLSAEAKANLAFGVP